MPYTPRDATSTTWIVSKAFDRLTHNIIILQHAKKRFIYSERRECVHLPRVPPFWTSAAPYDPSLSNHQENSHNRTVRDEAASLRTRSYQHFCQRFPE